MKIVSFCAYYTPEIAASMYLFENIFEDLGKAGMDVEIYVPTPTRGVDAETIKKTKKIKLEKKYNDRLTVHRFPMIQEGEGTVGRFLRYVLLTAKFFHYGLHTDADAMLIISTPPLQGPMAALLKKVRHIPYIYNLQDIFPDSLVNTGLSDRDSLLWKIGRKIEDFTYQNADKVVVISEDFKQNILAKGVPEDKIEIVMNWVEEQAVVSVPRENNTMFDEYGLDRNRFYVCYSGNIGHTQNMDMLLDIAKNLSDTPEIGFVIIGDGAYRKQVEERVKTEHISNVTLLPFQPYERISEVFSLGDCGLIISKSDVGSNSVPSKTWSIMSASRPVLASFDKGSDLDRIIEESKCGVCVQADDKAALQAAILAMMQNRDRATLGANGRRFIEEHLTRQGGTSKWIDIIKKL